MSKHTEEKYIVSKSERKKIALSKPESRIMAFNTSLKKNYE